LGWARAMGDEPDVASATTGLGEQWELAANTYKPYPAGIVMHAVIDACLALRRDHRLTGAEIAEITVSGDQLLLDRGDRIVANDRDARVSIHHCAAVAFQFGQAGLREFSDAAVHDPAVVALRALTKVRLNADSPRGAATATVRTHDGRVLTSTVTHAKGSTADPLTDAEIEAKVRDLAHQGDFAGSIDDVIASVWRLDALASIAPLIASLHPAT
jgi:2-methylcitrate dehydratase PrpD